MTISRGRAQAATGQAGKHEPLTELAAGIGATLVSRRRRSWQWTWLLPLSNCTPPGEKERGWELQSSSPTPTCICVNVGCGPRSFLHLHLKRPRRYTNWGCAAGFAAARQGIFCPEGCSEVSLIGLCVKNSREIRVSLRPLSECS